MGGSRRQSVNASAKGGICVVFVLFCSVARRVGDGDGRMGVFLDSLRGEWGFRQSE